MALPRQSSYPTQSPDSVNSREVGETAPYAQDGTMGGQNRGIEANTSGRESGEPTDRGTGYVNTDLGEACTSTGLESSCDPYGTQVAPKGQGGLTGGV